MVYRSDTAALEARLRALNDAVAQCTAERDEVVRLLRDARNCDAALRWLDERPVRQRRRRRGVLAALAAGVFAVSGLVAYRGIHRPQQTFEETLRQTAVLADQACTCSDEACARHVGDDLHEQSTQIVERGAYRVQPTEEQLERSKQIGARLIGCLNYWHDRHLYVK